ncbi:MAG: T9SS type A sorting domain-containing protein [Bacteroidota bacterium]
MKLRLFFSVVLSLMFVFSSNAQEDDTDCEINVRVFDDGWGDSVEWELTDADGEVVLSGGDYGSGYDDEQSLMVVNPPYQFSIEVDPSFFCDNAPSYEVSIGDEEEFSGEIILDEDDCVYTSVTEDFTTDLTDCIPDCFAPTGLQEDDITPYTVDVSWDAIDNASGGYIWEVYDADADPVENTPLSTGTVAEGVTSTTITDLDDDTAYDVYVIADCGAEDGLSYSTSVISIETLIACPAPENFEISEVLSASIQADWDEEPNASTGYQWEIYLQEDDIEEDDPAFSGTLSAGETTTTIEDLNENTDYTFVLIADCDEDGTSTTVQQNFTTLEACPTVDDFTVDDISTDEVELNWTISNDEFLVEYEIIYGESGFDPEEEQDNSLIVTNNSVTIDGLDNELAYDFYLVSICDDSESDFQEFTNFTFPIDGATCDMPAVVGTLPFTASGDTEDYDNNYTSADRPDLDDVQYSDGTGSENYLNGNDAVFEYVPSEDITVNIEITDTFDDWIGMYLFEGCSPFNSVVGYHTQTGSTSRAINEVTLEAGVAYYIVISSWGGANYTESTPFNLSVEEVLCVEPSDLEITEIEASTAEVSWESNGFDSNWIVVEEGDDPESDGDIVQEGTATDSQVSLTDLEPETSYEFYLRNDCDDEFSNFIDAESFTTLATCLPVENILITEIEADSAEISWDAVDNPADEGAYTWYVFEEGDDPETDDPITTGTTDNLVASVDDLEPSTTYEVYLETDCGEDDGLSQLSDAVDFTTTILPVTVEIGNPESDSYCYDNNEFIEWRYDSENGDPLIISFTNGSVEENVDSGGTYDDLIIYDGTDDTGVEIFNSEVDGHELEGLELTANSGSIYMTLDTDIVGSCQSEDDIETIEFDVQVDSEDPEFASVQLIHNSPDPAAEFVDVYVDGELAVEDFQFRTATEFLPILAEEEITVDIVPAGDDISNSVFTYTATLLADETYIVVANGALDPANFDDSVNGNIDFGFDIYEGAQTTSANADEVDVLVHHGSLDAPMVSVEETGQGAGMLVTDISYTEFDGYLSVAEDDYELDILDETGEILYRYEANLEELQLANTAITVIASGVLGVDEESEEFFGLWAALPSGGALVELEMIELSSEEFNSENFSYYPNPVESNLQVRAANTIEKVEIFNTLGQRLSTERPNNASPSINMSNLQSGVYLMKVTIEGATESFQVIKK